MLRKFADNEQLKVRKIAQMRFINLRKFALITVPIVRKFDNATNDPLYVKRKISEEIRKWDESGRSVALLIQGARQVGKTYAITEYGKERYGEHFLTINFADDEGAAKLFDGDLGADRLIERMSARYRDFRFVPGKTLIFLDEIQLCPNARTAIKPLVKDGLYKVITSGSLLGIRMREVRLNPTGYMERLDMHPMDFEEFLWAMNMPQNVIEMIRGDISRVEPIDEALFEVFTQLHNRYMAVGGMPEAVRMYSETRMFTDLPKVYDELFEEYIADIDRYADKDVRIRIKSCLRSIPAMLAQENKKFMYSRIVKDGTGENEGPKSAGFRYYGPALEWLQMAHLVNVCHNVTEPKRPLNERVKINTFKLYMMDTGLLLSRYEDDVFQEFFFGNPDVNRGAIGENAVAQAMTSQGRRLLYFSRDDPRGEVDFLTVVRGRLCCIEVKTGSNRDCKSLNNIMRQYDTSGIMFETRNIFQDDKGVVHYPLFAASFMDAIDPRPDVVDDLSFMDEVIRFHGAES